MAALPRQDASKQTMPRAGLTLRSGSENPNSAKHGGATQAERAFSAASTLMSGVMAISISQIMGAPLKFIDPKTYKAYMAWTKQNFAILVTAITEWWAPTVIRVSGDESMKGQLYQMDDGSLRCNFPHRIILMANHQLYTDWLYMWWIAYTNKMHGHIYIVLKESLKQVPIIGWGMQFFNFIFLSRKWENDQFTFKQHLGHLGNTDPAWLIIFPEGTNLSQVTRDKSASWSKKTGIPDMKHQLLPRTTGLQFCLEEMKSSMNWLYDATIAYEGVPKGGYGQDVFTLKSSFLEGRPPKSVNIFWRRFKISDIPYKTSKSFDRWLMNRWREKDYMLEYFERYGSFPAGDALQALATIKGRVPPQHAKAIVTEVKGGGWDEFLGIFGPVTTAAGAFSTVNAVTSLDFDQLVQQIPMPEKLKALNLKLAGNVEGGGVSDQGKIRIKSKLEASAKRTVDKHGANHPSHETSQVAHTSELNKIRNKDKQVAARPIPKPVHLGDTKTAAESANKNLSTKPVKLRKSTIASEGLQGIPVKSNMSVGGNDHRLSRPLSNAKQPPSRMTTSSNLYKTPSGR